MKVFICNNNFGESINFIEDENTFVGFSNSQECCECFGWSMHEEGAKDNDPEVNATPTTLAERIEEQGLQCSYPGYCFDKKYVKEINLGHDEGGKVMFRLLKDGAPNLILTLYNYHNGYYSHGFTFTVKGKIVSDGAI